MLIILLASFPTESSVHQVQLINWTNTIQLLTRRICPGFQISVASPAPNTLKCSEQFPCQQWTLLTWSPSEILKLSLRGSSQRLGCSLRTPTATPQEEELTSRTDSASHRWLGVCCRSGSPGQSWSHQWGRPSQSSHGRRSARRARTPLGTWPGSQMTCHPSRGFSNQQHLVLQRTFSSFTFSLPTVHCCSLTKSCPTLCDSMDCSMPGSPVPHYLLEPAQTHIHWVSDAIQPSHPLSSHSPAISLSQHQGLFQWVGCSYEDIFAYFPPSLISSFHFFYLYIFLL